eukprot:1543589-Pyramimonas_sp.AAC.2
MHPFYRPPPYPGSRAVVIAVCSDPVKKLARGPSMKEPEFWPVLLRFFYAWTPGRFLYRIRAYCNSSTYTSHPKGDSSHPSVCRCTQVSLTEGTPAEANCNKGLPLHFLQVPNRVVAVCDSSAC